MTHGCQPKAYANALIADLAVAKRAVRLLHLARIPDSSSMLPTLRRMPFLGPAKEQRATQHIIQVGNDEKSQRKERFETKRRTFEKNNCTDQTARETYESGWKSQSKERHPAFRCRRRHGQTGGSEERLFFLAKCKGAFIPNFTRSFPSFLRMGQGMGSVHVRTGWETSEGELGLCVRFC